jgi:hypothetical protein
MFETIQPVSNVSEPVHVHDCNDCTYKGTVVQSIDGLPQLFDVYYCPKHHEIIVRHGSDPDAYGAWPMREVRSLPAGSRYALIVEMYDL